MLAQSRASLPRGENWTYEFKWDGIRALLDVREGKLRISTRNGNDATIAYPELHAITALRSDMLLDGEIVAFDGAVPSFERLQHRMHLRDPQQIAEIRGRVPVQLVLFDLLRLDGVDLTSQPLRQRRELLAELVKLDNQGVSPWSVSPVFDDGGSTLAVAQTQGLEGVVAKQAASKYLPGKRSGDWVKVKLSKHADLAVIGWEAAADVPERLTSLVLGYYDPPGSSRLILAGKVSSGLTEETSRLLRRTLVPARTDSPAPAHRSSLRSPGRKVTWVEPTVVVEVSYTAWSSDGRLRHPVLLGLRPDKTPADVTREVTYAE